MGDLTPRQSLFVGYYLVSLSPADAYLEAGYKARTRKAASDMGLQLLDTPRIQAAVQEQLQAREARTLVTQDRVVTQMARAAFADMGEYVEWGENGVRLKDSSALTKEQRQLVHKVSERRSAVTGAVIGISIELIDKAQMLHDLGLHTGMFPKEPSGDINLNINADLILAAIFRRADDSQH